MKRGNHSRNRKHLDCTPRVSVWKKELISVTTLVRGTLKFPLTPNSMHQENHQADIKEAMEPRYVRRGEGLSNDDTNA